MDASFQRRFRGRGDGGSRGQGGRACNGPPPCPLRYSQVRSMVRWPAPVGMDETEKITISEGPPPTFEAVTEAWPLAIVEGPDPSVVAVCRMRTFNGPALVERCARAWRDGLPIHLEFRDLTGLTHQTQIIAARWTTTEEGEVLILWVRATAENLGVALFFHGDDDDESDEDGIDP